MVTFVLNGHYEWLDSDILNVMSHKIANDTLFMVSYPPRNDTKTHFKGEGDPMRNFEKSDGKWRSVNQQTPCLTCASPWCKYKLNKNTVKSIVEEEKTNDDGHTHRQKRFKCYVACAHHILINDNVGYRILLGYFILKFVRATFRENDPKSYTGFKHGNEIHQYPGNSSDSS